MRPEARAGAPAPGTAAAILAWRLSFLEALPWLLAIAAFFAVPSYLALGANILVMILFALSLDVLTGYAGVVTLGHAVFFGIGAYAAGLIAKSGWTEPFSGLVLAALLTGVSGVVLGFVLSQMRGIALTMTTMALGLIAYEGAKSASWLTGGDEGLQGFAMAPVFGVFHWTVYGQTAYLYALAWLFVLFAMTRMVVTSSFGLAMQGLRENYGRMQLIGAPVRRHMIGVFLCSSILAGAAGALSAQTTSFVDVNVFSIDISAAILVMLVLGGLGRLYGAFVGTVVYMVVHDVASGMDPFHWMFVIGALLIIVVLFSREGLVGLAIAMGRKLHGRAA
jgi:branched-chain amino acid transport system permease protein